MTIPEILVIFYEGCKALQLADTGNEYKIDLDVESDSLGITRIDKRWRDDDFYREDLGFYELTESDAELFKAYVESELGLTTQDS